MFQGSIIIRPRMWGWIGLRGNLEFPRRCGHRVLLSPKVMVSFNQGGIFAKVRTCYAEMKNVGTFSRRIPCQNKK